VDHRDRVAGGRRDEVEFVVDVRERQLSSTTIAKMLVPALTLPVRGRDGIRRHHSGPRVALGRAQRDAGAQCAGRSRQGARVG
jgi:hypothetical protein